MVVRSYQDLVVWTKAMDLAQSVYEMTKTLPREEIYGLASQIRRAVVSVASNIAKARPAIRLVSFCTIFQLPTGHFVKSKRNYISHTVLATSTLIHCI